MEKEERLAQRRRLNALRKIGVIRHYSNGAIKCAKCDCSDIRALTIDHINGYGALQRRILKRSSGTAFYHWLVTNNYPTGFQVLCMNCQFIKRWERKEKRGHSIQEINIQDLQFPKEAPIQKIFDKIKMRMIENREYGRTSTYYDGVSDGLEEAMRLLAASFSVNNNSLEKT